MGLDILRSDICKESGEGYKTIKKEVNQNLEAKYTKNRQNMWERLKNVEYLEIAARRLALTVNILINISIIMKGGAIEWFLKVMQLYEEFD